VFYSILKTTLFFLYLQDPAIAEPCIFIVLGSEHQICQFLPELAGQQPLLNQGYMQLLQNHWPPSLATPPKDCCQQIKP